MTGSYLRPQKTCHFEPGDEKSPGEADPPEADRLVARRGASRGDASLRLSMTEEACGTIGGSR